MKKPRRTITTDYLQAKLKLGWIAEDFCTDLEISEEDLRDFIERHSNNRFYSEFFSNVKKNEQIVKKRQRAEEKKTNLTDEDAHAQQTVFLELTGTSNNAPVSTPQILEESPTDAKIRELKAEMGKRETELSSNSNLKNKLANEIAETFNKIQKLKADCDKLKTELDSKKHQLENSSSRLIVMQNHLKQVEKDIEETKKNISNVQYEIRELQKISITVHKNGEISIDKNVQIPASWEQIYSKLIEDSIVDNITIKQIRQLAKIIALNETLSKENAYFQFIFEYNSSDGDSIKTLFELLTEKSS